MPRSRYACRWVGCEYDAAAVGGRGGGSKVELARDTGFSLLSITKNQQIRRVSQLRSLRRMPFALARGTT